MWLNPHHSLTPANLMGEMWVSELVKGAGVKSVTLLLHATGSGVISTPRWSSGCSEEGSCAHVCFGAFLSVAACPVVSELIQLILCSLRMRL